MSQIPNTFQKYSTFVLCGGKCGSQTLNATLNAHGLVSLHVHGNVQFQKVVLKSSVCTLYELMDYARSRHPHIFVFDVYRPPIERTISSFFHNITQHVPHITRSVTVQDLMNHFTKERKFYIEDYHPMTDYLNHLGIEKPPSFDMEKQYCRIDYKNITCIKLRFTSMSAWESILSDLLSRPIKLVNTNLSESRWYYSLYQEFVRLYRPPVEWLQFIRRDPHFQYFMSPDEQIAYFAKWAPTTSIPVYPGLTDIPEDTEHVSKNT